MNRATNVSGYRIQFGNRLRERRLHLKLKQLELATRAGIHVNFVSELERGLKSPTLDTIVALAKALEIEPDYFFPHANPPQTPSSEFDSDLQWLKQHTNITLHQIIDLLKQQSQNNL